MNKREAHWIHDDKGGYWQIPVGGEPYNFRTPPGFVMHPKGEAVTDAEILWDMRHIDDHLKYSEDAASMLIQGVRRVLRRVMRPTEAQAQGGGDMTECGHSKYDPCHNCEPLDAPPIAPVGVWAVVADMRRWVKAAESSGPYAAGRTVVVQEWANQLEALAQQPAAEAHCTTCSCVPGMTPAIRFDATPAEKEGAVRDHLIRMGWTPPAEAQPVAWSTDKPKRPGVYGVRGFNLCRGPEEQFEAIVSVRLYEGDLICNLHESTSEDDFDRWAPIEDCSDGFEWCEFVPAHPPPSAPALPLPGDRGSVQALFNPQPPAEAQPRGRGCGDHDHASYIPGCGLCAATLPEKRMAAPQSAPVGVEVGVVREYLDASACYDPALRHPNSPEGLRLREARNALDTAIALARQPAATLPNVDDDDLTVAYMAGRHDGRKEAQQPAAVDEEEMRLAYHAWFRSEQGKPHEDFWGFGWAVWKAALATKQGGES